MRGKPDKPFDSLMGPSAASLAATLLAVRAAQRAPIETVCAAGWLHEADAESGGGLPEPLCVDGEGETRWEAEVAGRLEAMGCPAPLVQHHVTAGTCNHVTAAYEVLLHEPAAPAARPVPVARPGDSLL